MLSLDEENGLIRAIKSAELRYVELLLSPPPRCRGPLKAMIKNLAGRPERHFMELRRAGTAAVRGDDGWQRRAVRAMRRSEACRIRMTRLHKRLDAVAGVAGEETWREAVRMTSIEYNSLRQRLVTGKHGFLRQVVKTYAPILQSESTDLLQEASMGLLRAIDKYDPDKGYKFVTYAGWWVRHYVRRSISDKGRIVRIPVHICDAISTFAAEADRMRRDGLSVDHAVIAEKFGATEQKVKSALSSARFRPRSLNEPAFRGDPDSPVMMDALEAESRDPLEEIESERITADVRAVIDMLPERQRMVIRWRFGIGSPEQCLREIGDKLGLSRERVRQIESEAMDVMGRKHAVKRYRGGVAA